MTTAEIIVNVISGLALLVTIIGGFFNLVSRLSRIELKVDTMWDFQMRRGVAEAVSKGMGTVNSPLVVSPVVKEWYAPIADELISFYTDEGHKLEERDLFIAIEKKFGDRLLKEVCIPRGLFVGSCIWGAIDVAKNKLS